MIEKLTHLPVNFIDGMKINKRYFIDIQNFVIDSVRDAIGVHTSMLTYGLLPTNDPVRINLSVDAHKYLRVRIEECHAITPNGSRIEISSNTEQHSLSLSYPEIVKEIKDEEVALLACISVNPFKRIPCGEPDPEENPPRDPYTEPEYYLSLVKEEELRKEMGVGGHYLIVGKIWVSGTSSHLDESYIPPCVLVASYKRLQELYSEIDRFYGQMEIYAVQIAQKIHTKNQTNPLATIIEQMTDRMLYYLATEINRFRWLTLYSTPSEMLVSVVGFARVLKNFIDARSGIGKEELLNYFSDWCNVSQGEFEMVFSEAINAEYNHNQIEVSVVRVERFMKTLEDLFAILNRLDYIGKKRDGSIFVSEITNEKSSLQPQRSKTFLAD
ncbi:MULTISPECIES: hypothetical protein [Capnocytophaga]|uniref:hypothetical protein n=1 Tax=Capnocytophaga TaxID=1016 RepID=UPI00020C73F7|nr:MULTISPECIES: hypothetical protein [unclassified Capnocytophaga]KHE68080.1 hypothetical protein HMPREF9074_09345 [Capnocytophaga sp. oral taxon 329 str. F0087]QGS17538.1 hypothetical protein FOC45_04420 [Capnocytophaga sp. FDAARGOS_737]